MKKIKDTLKTKKVLVSDGAWGTFLQAKGLKPGECPELWNIDRPNDVLEIAESYIAAGSDMIETNSFGGTKFKLSNYGLQDRVGEINEAAAAISRKAAGDKIVIGSIGPTGKMIMMGEVTPEEMYEGFKEQAIALEKGGVDAIVIETMTDLEEAQLAVKAVKENTDCEAICTMTFDKTVDGTYRTMMGISPTDFAIQIVEAGADGIGANCGNGMADMISIVKEIRQVDANTPILIHANAGAPRYEDGKTVFPEGPTETASFIADIINAGANIVGGCCGTTPDHIKRIVEEVKKVS